jgi:predicted MFS family arabinose efflux permease
VNAQGTALPRGRRIALVAQAASGAELDASAGARARSRFEISAILFLCLFASQAGLIALAPVLAQVAGDLGVSTATAGQLRTVSGLTAGAGALVLAFSRRARRLGLRELLVAGAVVLVVGSGASALAPGFAWLLGAQVLIGVAVALLVTAGTSAAAEWSAPEDRARVLSWTLIGNPAAWIVGMPLIGALGEVSWRYVWIALPLVAGIAAAGAASYGPRTTERSLPSGRLSAALADEAASRWLVGEVLANSAWIGMLVYAGALLADSYDASPTSVGITLALAASAFVAGSLFFRRSVTGDTRRSLMRMALALAVLMVLVGAVRESFLASGILLSGAAFVAGGRTLLGSSFGLAAAPEHRMALMGARAAANQFGYFFGAAIGGVAIAVSGYAGLGLVLGTLFVAAALSLSRVGHKLRASVLLPRWSSGSWVLSSWSTKVSPSPSAGASSVRSSPSCS